MPGCAARLREELGSSRHEWEDHALPGFRESSSIRRSVGDVRGCVSCGHEPASSLSIFLRLGLSGFEWPFGSFLDANGGQMPRILRCEASFSAGLEYRFSSMSVKIKL